MSPEGNGQSEARENVLAEFDQTRFLRVDFQSECWAGRTGARGRTWAVGEARRRPSQLAGGLAP